jgi:hypothetical protein
MSRKYTKEIVDAAAKISYSKRQLCENLGVNICGGTVGMISARLKEYGTDISHFRKSGWNVGCRKKSAQEILILRVTGGREKSLTLKRAMIECGIVQECANCGLGSEWNGKPIVNQIDHINGNPLDDRLENLRFLCPNCHSQTDNWKSRIGSEPNIG